MDDLSAPYEALVSAEPLFGSLVETYGTVDPFIWHDGGRTGGSKFAAMVLHMTAQQISIKVAFTIFDRIAALAGGVPTADRVIKLDVDQLRSTGLSTGKSRYIHALAQSQIAGEVDLEGMDSLSDEEAITQLVTLPGIGVWTAEMFLIHQLHRADVLPAGDIGIRRGIQKLWVLTAPPDIPDTVRRAQAWSPYRTFASALLWRSLAAVNEISDPKERAVAAEIAANAERKPS